LKRTISIVGGGACALMLACCLDPAKFIVNIYESNAAAGRKFLVAGQGGLNITHSEDASTFINKYTPNSFIKEAFSTFSNQDLVNWLEGISIETYTGSSGRIFPIASLKPVTVLNAFLDKIKKNGFTFHFHHLFNGFDSNNQLLFLVDGKEKAIASDLVIFCMGGASWPVTGSTGSWSSFLKLKNITINPFQASNCSFEIKWPQLLIEKIEGKILKNVSFSCSDVSCLGEAVITKTGIEGSGVYPLSPQIREQIQHNGSAEIYLDLKPQLNKEKIIEKILSIKGKSNFSDELKRQLNLPSYQLQLLKAYLSKEDFQNADKLANQIKQLRLKISSCGPIENAISTVGGIDLTEIDSDFMLKKLPNHFAIGEMLDYDAPTGGYLLQSCFSMAFYLAKHLNKKFY